MFKMDKKYFLLEVERLRKAVEEKKYKLNAEDIQFYNNRHRQLAESYFKEDVSEIKTFSTLDGEFSVKAERIVFGAHGPYIEFDLEDSEVDSLEIPADQKWRLSEEYKVKYIYFVPKGREEKIYYQIDTVSYADYKKEKFYIDLYNMKKEKKNVK